ncbi:MAG: HepT-like ribonuclease domain-containing protein [Acetobacteraceae bacterium]
MPSSDPVQRFEDIVENIARVERFTRGMDMKAFAGNEQAIHAVKYALVIISEAAAKLGDTAVALCPDIPWREVRGLGNRLRHDYDTIDTVRIWLLVERDLPTLKAACEVALRGPAKSKPAC